MSDCNEVLIDSSDGKKNVFFDPSNTEIPFKFFVMCSSSECLEHLDNCVWSNYFTYIHSKCSPVHDVLENSICKIEQLCLYLDFYYVHRTCTIQIHPV